MKAVLDGVRVLDLSRYVAGPHCGMMLGDFGADVVKVERPGRGDDLRGVNAGTGDDSIYSLMYNRNKRSVALDYRAPGAAGLLLRLAEKADVLVENFRPGTLEKMGIGPDRLQAANPRLVIARISGFGQDGPWAGRPAFDAIAQAEGGIMAMTGERGSPPVMAGVVAMDYATGLHAVIGILLALKARESTGKGQVVEATLMDSALSFLMTAIPDYLRDGVVRGPNGNRDRYSAPTNTFQAKDGRWVYVMAVSDPHFANLARAMGRPDLLDDPRYGQKTPRFENEAGIEAIITAWVAGLESGKVMEALQAHGVPSGLVAETPDIVANPQVRHRGKIVEVEHAKHGRVPMQGNPVTLTDQPASIRRAVPTVGQQTDEVLAEWLGLDAAGIGALRAAGVIGSPSYPAA